MNDATIGRNYAETLLFLARREKEAEEWGTLIESVAEGMREDRMLRTFLESPKIAAAQKIEIIQKALGKRVPHLFLRFLETVILKRRQMVILKVGDTVMDGSVRRRLATLRSRMLATVAP